ncbi:MAG: copper transporter [Bifidobacteriaceae bacterium]|jgi:hypothetical protein|nr:copper transporter [Bifidobacteriaceae bacterium]
MINFRYHIVSLAAVFLALAVGIVLGAGPLRGPITANLEEQVTSLRDEKDTLRDELSLAEADTEYRDATIEGLLPMAADAVLQDLDVAVVSVGHVEAQTEAAFAEALRLADAQIVSRVRVREGWWLNSPKQLLRQAWQVDGQRGPQPEVEDDPSPEALAEADTAIATALIDSLVAESTPASGAGVSGGTVSGGEQDDGEQPHEAALDELERAGLVNVDELTAPAGGLVILLADDLARRAAEEEDPQWEREDSAVLSLIAAAGERSPGTVVVGRSQVEADLLARARQDDSIAGAVSTLDGVSTPALALGCVWALAANLQGVSGHFGQDADARGGRLLSPRMPLRPIATQSPAAWRPPTSPTPPAPQVNPAAGTPLSPPASPPGGSRSPGGPSADAGTPVNSSSPATVSTP